MSKKTALITGAAKRIGRAIAYCFADEGIDIVLHYNKSEKDAVKLQSSLEKAGVRTWIFQADLSNPEETNTLFDKVITECGTIDYLVNNASLFPKNTLKTFTEQSLLENIRVNAFAPLLLSRNLLSHLNIKKRKGKIVNLLDARITDYDYEHTAYHLSKRMLYDITRLTALEFSPNIAVNAVAPGLILPPPGKDEEFLKNMSHTNPLHSYGTLKEITDTVMFFINSEFITGQVIYVDGGRHLKGCLY